MTTWTKRAVLLACALLAAAAVHAADRKPEKLLGLRADGDKGELAIDVWASGCTEKAHFKVERAGDQLTVFRLQRDSCKMMPQRTTITFTFAEVGLRPNQAFTVRNPFTSDPSAASVD